MERRFGKTVYPYYTLRKYFQSDSVAMEMWKLIDTTNMTSEGAKLLIDFAGSIADEGRQTELIDAVWHRYYQQIAEKALP